MRNRKDHWERVYQKHAPTEVGWYQAYPERSLNLTKDEDRKGYVNSLNQALKLNGHLIIATFSLDAPAKCSGLPVVRYSPETLQNELGDNLNLVEALVEDHVTPSGVKQNFIFCRFYKFQ